MYERKELIKKRQPIEAGMLILDNILPFQWDDVMAKYEQERRRQGLEFWTSIKILTENKKEKLCKK